MQAEPRPHAAKMAAPISGGTLEELVDKVSDLLHEAAETHHIVFRITDGADDDWATWYADWLSTLSELPAVLGTLVVRSELTATLVRLSGEYQSEPRDEPWETYYARGIVERFHSAG